MQGRRSEISLGAGFVLSCLAGLMIFLMTGQQMQAQNAAPNPSAPPLAAGDLAKTAPKKAADTPPPGQPATPDARQAQIVADTQKLLKLSQELKAEVAKSDKNTLSLTVVKKADEVEKLAKIIKEETAKGH